MAEQLESPEDLHSFAEMLVMQLVGKAPTAWQHHDIRDAIHDLFLAGWTDWKATQDVGLAKNRMVSRRVNLIRDRAARLERQKKTLPLDNPPDTAPQPADRPRAGENQEQEAQVNEFLARLPEQQRRIVQFRMAGMTNPEIAGELGIPLRSVERTLETLREEMKHGDAQ
jgi:RNA polymerase sigma factor (sigma-70 family)